MTKEQAATNAPTLTKELVDKITSFNIKNCLDEIDNQKDLSESEIEELFTEIIGTTRSTSPAAASSR